MREWFQRPARQLEHLRLEGFSESEVDGFVLRAALQRAALTLIAAGLLGSAVYALASVQRVLALVAGGLYCLAVAVYAGANLFAAALHLLIVTQRYSELRREGASLQEFGSMPLKVAANLVSVMEQAGLAAFAFVLLSRLWPE